MNLTELKRLAKVATSGERGIEPGCYDTCPVTATEFPHGPVMKFTKNNRVIYFDQFWENDAEFISACTPERIIALLRVVEAAQFAFQQWPTIAFEELSAIREALRDLETTP